MMTVYTQAFLQQRQDLAEEFWRESCKVPGKQWKDLPIDVRMYWLGQAADYQRAGEYRSL